MGVEESDRVRGRIVTLKWVMVWEYEEDLLLTAERMCLPAGMGLASWVWSIEGPVSVADLNPIVKV